MKKLLVLVICMFIWALFVWLGWNIIAWNFNLPQFAYWQTFLILTGLRSIVKCLEVL